MSIRIGIIGPGRISDDQLAPGIGALDDAVLWSVLSRDLRRASNFAEKHGAISPNPAHTDLSSMLADSELDAVIVATPDRFHAEQACAAAEAGKHVFVEKPMATSVAEAQSIIDACQTGGRVLAIAYHLRWHTGLRTIRDRIQQGEIGSVRHIRVHWTFRAADDSDWRAFAATGRWWSLAANGTHCLDLIRWMLRPEAGEVVAIQAVTGGSVWETPHDETAMVSARFESGATAEFCTSVLFDSASRVEIYGSDGTVICDDTLGRHGAGTILFNGSPLEYEVVNPYEGEIRDFVEAIRDGRAPEVDGHEGMRNVALLIEAAKNL